MLVGSFVVNDCVFAHQGADFSDHTLIHTFNYVTRHTAINSSAALVIRQRNFLLTFVLGLGLLGLGHRFPLTLNSSFGTGSSHSFGFRIFLVGLFIWSFVSFG